MVEFNSWKSVTFVVTNIPIHRMPYRREENAGNQKIYWRIHHFPLFAFEEIFKESYKLIRICKKNSIVSVKSLKFMPIHASLSLSYAS